MVKNSILNQTKHQNKLSDELKDLTQKAQELKKLQGVKQEYEALHVSLKEQTKLKEYSLTKDGLNKEQIQLKEQWKKSKADIQLLEKSCEMQEQYVFDEKNLAQDISVRQDEIEAKQTIEKELELEISAEQRVINEANTKVRTHKKHWFEIQSVQLVLDLFLKSMTTL